MKIIRNISRLLLGLVFMFSGFVKAVDPLGSQYKFEDYFIAFGVEWLIPVALTLSIVLSSLEFFLGVVFFFNIKVRKFAWLMLLFMLFFLILTFVLAITDLVTDCGCFGDAIVLSNWQTFYKNVILMLPVMIVFFTRKKFINKTAAGIQTIFALVGIAFILWTAFYSLRHLPLIDFMPWKKGVLISEQVIPTPEIAEVYLIYKHKVTGEEFEYTAKTLPYKDTLLWPNLEFVDQKKKIIQEYKDAPIHDFMIDDRDRNNHNAGIIGNHDWQFLLVCYDLDKTEVSVFDKINAFAEECAKDSVSFVGLTGSDWQKIDLFRFNIKAKFDFYAVDGTALKSVVRSNPGLILLKDGVVVDKWAWRDIPDYGEFRANQIKYLEFLNKKYTRDTL